MTFFPLYTQVLPASSRLQHIIIYSTFTLVRDSCPGNDFMQFNPKSCSNPTFCAHHDAPVKAQVFKDDVYTMDTVTLNKTAHVMDIL